SVWKEAEIEFLVEGGHRETARTNAASGTPAIRVVVDSSDAQFAAAMKRVADMKITDDPGIDLATYQYAVPASFITGKPLKGVDKMYAHYLEPDHTKVTGDELSQFSALMMCL